MIKYLKRDPKWGLRKRAQYVEGLRCFGLFARVIRRLGWADWVGVQSAVANVVLSLDVRLGREIHFQGLESRLTSASCTW